jgi:hypothetical protein
MDKPFTPWQIAGLLALSFVAVFTAWGGTSELLHLIIHGQP